MIISHAHRFVFVHAPKTGGTSLSIALDPHLGDEDVVISQTPRARELRGNRDRLRATGRVWKHSKLTDIADDEFAGYRVFSLVRNPFDRMVSYYHWLRMQKFDQPAVNLAKALEFREFAAHASTISGFRANPYRSYVSDRAGRDICDLYIRLEHLPEDIAALRELIGLELDVPHENRSEREADWRGYYDAASREAVETACSLDLAQFNYRFDP